MRERGGRLDCADHSVTVAAAAGAASKMATTIAIATHARRQVSIANFPPRVWVRSPIRCLPSTWPTRRSRPYAHAMTERPTTRDHDEARRREALDTLDRLRRDRAPLAGSALADAA